MTEAAAQAHGGDDLAAQVDEAHDVGRAERDRRHALDAEDGLGVQDGEAERFSARKDREVAFLACGRDIRN